MIAAGTASSLADVAAAMTQPGAPFEMREVEIDGRPTRVWVRSPRSLRAVLEDSIRAEDRTFLVSPTGRLSFGAHRRAVEALATRLVEEVGVRPGDRVAIAMQNWPEWSVAFWSIVAIGAVAVPLNAWWSGPELAFALADCGAVAAVADPERMQRIAGRLPPTMRSVLVPRGEQSLPAPAQPVDLLGLAADTITGLPPVAIAPEDTATIFYTSGTTGRPKGVVGSHRNICTNLLSRAFWRTCHTSLADIPTADPSAGVTLLTVPLFHVTGCHSYLLPALAAGSVLVLMDRWDPFMALDLIQRERVTAVGGVPATILRLLDAYDPAVHDLSTLTAITVGGAPNPPALCNRIRQILPKAVLGNGYGMTETSSVATYSYGPDCVDNPSSIGRLVPVMDARVVAPEGVDAPQGTEGELWLRGPNVASAYWMRPQESAEAMTADGWLKTGDLAVLDHDGMLTLVGRKKELIMRGGENISPFEVEAALFEHPAVTDAGVVGAPHPDLGEQPVAYVTVRPNSKVTGDELRSYLRGRIAHFKIPTRISIVAEPLPRSPQGKLLRQQLEAWAAG